MTVKLSDEIIEKCYYFGKKVNDDTKPNIYGKLYQNIYNSDSNYIHYFPKILVLQLTSACNLRCKHCFFSNKQEKYNADNNLTREELLKQIRYFTEEVNILHCTITGGEIFTSPFLFDVVEYLKKENISLKLITNGTLINEKYAEKIGNLLNPKYDIIQISIDGAKAETNDFIRGEGTYNRILNGIKLLRQKRCNIELGFTINSKNVNEISEIYKLAKEYEISKINFGRFSIQHESQSHLVPNIEDIFFNIKKLSDIYDGSVKLRIPCLTVPDYLNYKFGELLLDKELVQTDNNITNLKCRPHDEQVTMFADGSISLCYDCTINDVLIGNIKNTPFEDIWNNRFKNPIFQNRELKDHACKKCKYISLCKAGCPYRSVITYGTTLMPGYDCKYYEKLKELL